MSLKEICQEKKVLANSKPGSFLKVQVGVKLLQGDFKAAVDAILQFAPASLAADKDPTSAMDRVSRDDKARAHAIHTFKTTAILHSLFIRTRL